MKKLDLKKLYKTQVSLTEWFDDIKHKKTQELRAEDNAKRERLAVLNKIIGLPFDKPTQFPAKDLVAKTETFNQFYAEHQNDLCALRLIPNKPDFPKLRLRGVSIKEAMRWFKKQNIAAGDYKADFVPHGDNQLWSTIFVVNKHGIFGEIIKGGHYQLTQGFYDLGKPITFNYDFKKLTLSGVSKSKQVEKYLLNLFRYLEVKDKKLQTKLKRKLAAKLYSNYLGGYFETSDDAKCGLWFIDYNRILGDFYAKYGAASNTSAPKQKKLVKGQVASYGKATGCVKIIDPTNPFACDFTPGDILVCTMTTPELVPLMKKAAAIITDFGGILSHAAIVSRELNVPCIVGTQNATKVLKDGCMIRVDTELEEVVVV